MIGVAPDASRSLVDRIRSQPVESFVYGIATYVAVVVSLLTTIPPLSELVNFVVGTFGMGAIAAQYWERRQS